MPQTSPHHSSAARSCCSALWPTMEWMGWYMRQSFAHNLSWEVTTLGKSSICIKNIGRGGGGGAKTIPWGTHEITLVGWDLEPSITTFSYLVFKKVSLLSITGPCMPRKSSSQMRCLRILQDTHVRETGVIPWHTAILLLEDKGDINPGPYNLYGSISDVLPEYTG